MNSHSGAGSSSHRIITPLSNRRNGIISDIGSASSLLRKRPFSCSASPLAKKLFRPDSQSQSSPSEVLDGYGGKCADNTTATGDFAMHSDFTPVVSLVLEVSEGLEGEAERLVNDTSQRHLLVDPSLLTLGPRLADGGKIQVDSPWHCRSIIRLIRRLRSVSRLISDRWGGTVHTNVDEDDCGPERSLEDVSIDAVNLGRRVISFVQRHRRGLRIRPQMWTLHSESASKTWGIEVCCHHYICLTNW